MTFVTLEGNGFGAMILSVAASAGGGFAVGVSPLYSTATGDLQTTCQDGTTMERTTVGTWSSTGLSLAHLVDVACRPLSIQGHMPTLDLIPAPGPHLQVSAHDAKGSVLEAKVARVPGTAPVQ
jgi:hypothetical protein